MSNSYNNKKYYWLKLGRHFFKEARIKKIRKLAGGDTYAIIYLEILLLSIERNGVIEFEGVEPTIEEELALKLDEKTDDVKVAWNLLKQLNMIKELQNSNYLMVEAEGKTGTETQSNVYKKELAKKRELEKIQSPSNPIPIDIDIERDIEIDIEIDADTIAIDNAQADVNDDF